MLAELGYQGLTVSVWRKELHALPLVGVYAFES